MSSQLLMATTPTTILELRKWRGRTESSGPEHQALAGRFLSHRFKRRFKNLENDDIKVLHGIRTSGNSGAPEAANTWQCHPAGS